MSCLLLIFRAGPHRIMLCALPPWVLASEVLIRPASTCRVLWRVRSTVVCTLFVHVLPPLSIPAEGADMCFLSKPSPLWRLRVVWHSKACQLELKSSFCQLSCSHEFCFDVPCFCWIHDVGHCVWSVSLSPCALSWASDFAVMVPWPCMPWLSPVVCLPFNGRARRLFLSEAPCGCVVSNPSKMLWTSLCVRRSSGTRCESNGTPTPSVAAQILEDFLCFLTSHQNDLSKRSGFGWLTCFRWVSWEVFFAQRLFVVRHLVLTPCRAQLVVSINSQDCILRLVYGFWSEWISLVFEIRPECCKIIMKIIRTAKELFGLLAIMLETSSCRRIFSFPWAARRNNIESVTESLDAKKARIGVAKALAFQKSSCKSLMSGMILLLSVAWIAIARLDHSFNRYVWTQAASCSVVAWFPSSVWPSHILLESHKSQSQKETIPKWHAGLWECHWRTWWQGGEGFEQFCSDTGLLCSHLMSQIENPTPKFFKMVY